MKFDSDGPFEGNVDIVINIILKDENLLLVPASALPVDPNHAVDVLHHKNIFILQILLHPIVPFHIITAVEIDVPHKALSRY